MRVICSLLVAALLLTGCDFIEKAAVALGDLSRLRTELQEKTACPVSLNLNNGSFLSIGLINSQLKSLQPEQKQLLAREIARYALTRYRERDKLENVNVCFVTQKSILVFNYTNATDSYKFPAVGLRKGAGEASR